MGINDDFLSNYRKAKDISKYLENLLFKISNKYSAFIAFNKWNDEVWSSYKDKTRKKCKDLYRVDHGYWDGWLLEIDEYINSLLIEPNKLELIIYFRELVLILYDYNKLEFLKLKNNKSKNEEKLLSKLNKKILVPQHLIWVNDYLYESIKDTKDISYYKNNLLILKKLKTFLSEPLHAYSIFYNNSFQNSETLDDFYKKCTKITNDMLNKILKKEVEIEEITTGSCNGNIAYSYSGPFFDPRTIRNFRDHILIKYSSMLNVILEKFDSNLNSKINLYKTMINNAK